MINDDDLDFVSMGMFIIDEIHAPTRVMKDVVGGAGAWSAIGARLFRVPPHSKRISWTVDMGSDFPEPVKELLDSYETAISYRLDPNRLTTRGWNEYAEDDKRAFKYQTPRKRIEAHDLTSKMLASKSFHIISSAARVGAMVTCINEKRKTYLGLGPPLYAWEPVPDMCKTEELQTCLQVIAMVDVFTPNHLEAGQFYGKSVKEGDRESIEQLAENFKRSMRQGGLVIIRSGGSGCYVDCMSHSQWLPAYYGRESKKVQDTTGAGNAFIGGLCIGLLEEKDEIKSVCYGQIAASFAIEQTGLPKRSLDENAHEVWNQKSVSSRLKAYLERVGLA